MRSHPIRDSHQRREESEAITFVRLRSSRRLVKKKEKGRKEVMLIDLALLAGHLAALAFLMEIQSEVKKRGIETACIMKVISFFCEAGRAKLREQRMLQCLWR